MSAPQPCVLLATGSPSRPTFSRVQHDGTSFIVSSDDECSAVPDDEIVDRLAPGATDDATARALFVALAQAEDVTCLCVSAYRDTAGWADVRTGEPLSHADLRATMVFLLAALAECGSPAPVGAAA